MIPAQATAKVSLRLVPGQSYVKVARQLERAVAELAPRWAEVKVTLLHGGDPVRVDVDHPAFAVLDEAFEAVTGRPAVRVRSGGSIPIVPELGLAARRCCSPGSACRTTGSTPPTKNSTSLSSGAGSRCSGGSSSCSPRRARSRAACRG